MLVVSFYLVVIIRHTSKASPWKYCLTLKRSVAQKRLGTTAVYLLTNYRLFRKHLKKITYTYTETILHTSFSDYNKTSDGWLEWNGTQYYINNERNAMTDARKFCQQRHGDLVSFTSEAESIFLWQQVSSDMYTTLLMLFIGS